MQKNNIVVLVKQVIDTRTPIKIDCEAKQEISRDQLPAIINPEDLQALALARKFKELSGYKITVVSMGPPRAELALREALSLCADEAVLLADRRFAGADTLATSYALTLAIKKLDAAIVFSGSKSIDGDTGHVGAQVAQQLSLPQLCYVSDIVSFDSNNDSVTVVKNNDYGREILKSRLPAVVTVCDSEVRIGFTNVRRMLAMKHHPITTWTVDDLDGDLLRLGASGSPTKVIGSEDMQNAERENKQISADETGLAELFAALGFSTNYTV